MMRSPSKHVVEEEQEQEEEEEVYESDAVSEIDSSDDELAVYRKIKDAKKNKCV